MSSLQVTGATTPVHPTVRRLPQSFAPRLLTPTRSLSARATPHWQAAVMRWLRHDERPHAPLRSRPHQAVHEPNATALSAWRARLRQRLQAPASSASLPDERRAAHRQAGLRLLLGDAAVPALQWARHWTGAALAAGVPLPAPRLQALALSVLPASDVAAGEPPHGLAHFAARAWAALAPLVPPASRTVVRDALWQQLQGRAGPAETGSMDAAPGALQPGEQALVADAGLVLCAPFLPRLWQRLELLSPDGQAFATPAAAARAVQLMRLLATGRTETPEHLLVLPRLLCALPEHQPLDAVLAPTTAEREALDGLLLAMIRHWKRLGSTSPAGLRETFLSRPGQLERGETHWRLRVESRAFDMLLDDLPWAFKTVRLPWMPEVLHVEWR